MDNNSSDNPNQPSSPFPPAGDPMGAAPPDPNAGAQLPDPMSLAGDPPAAPAASGWPSSSDQMGGLPPTGGPFPAIPVVSDPSQIPTAPQASLDSNPFLQQTPAAPGMPEAPAAPAVTPTDPAQLGAAPPIQDPLNTAFAPVADPSQPNPFGGQAAPVTPAPAAPAVPEPEQAAPAQGLPDFMNPNAAPPPNPVADMAAGSNQMQNSDETVNQAASSETSFGQSGPNSSPGGTIDLSAVQSGDTPPPNPLDAPGNGNPNPIAPPTGAPLPEMGPVENAPTDLSHLIAGEGEHQAPGDIYTPPVAQDQTPSVGQPQQPAQPGTDGAPPEKHLNLTKVLLVAGIPILLIVAALSAYLILGIGKPQASPEPTSLPIQTQAPLTNPPQQIAEPSPVELPSPSESAVFAVPSASSSATLPSSSPSPLSALEQLRARQSASPSPASSSSP